MSVDEDDDDTQSFYSMVPWDEPAMHRDWPKAAAAYHAQSDVVPPEQTPSYYCALRPPDLDAQRNSTAEHDSPAALSLPASPRRPRGPHKAPLALLPRHLPPFDARKENAQTRHSSQRPSTSGGEHTSTRGHADARADAAVEVRKTRSKTLFTRPDLAHAYALLKLEGAVTATNMDSGADDRQADLFLELASDQSASENKARPTSHGEPLQSRPAFSSKRRSLPPASSAVEARPNSSSHFFAGAPIPRPDPTSALQHHLDRYGGSSNRAMTQADDLASVSSRSRSSAPRRSFNPAERASALNEQTKSPEMPQYGRRRPSFGASPRLIHKPHAMHLTTQLQGSYSQSPGDASEPKRSIPDSASVDSETADTVWDELDDLKSRIKKLELTGKLPPTSAAALSTEHSDRPRTATTAPTTIDSSPKHDKSDMKEKKIVQEPELVYTEALAEYTVGGPDVANIHPNLHAALTKAKPLLNPSLYRPLEATAADALQLAAMTGSAGPQGTALTAAAIINGVTVSDRHVRRKADTMCRNLTDLVLALCEGKIETSNAMSSPAPINTPTTVRSPSLRYSRSSLDPNDGLIRTKTRPMSRLEARRSSMLGSHGGSSLGNSPLESGEDVSASEHESTASRARPQRESFGQVRAVSRLQAARARHYDETGTDEDSTLRPISRAATDFTRTKSLSGRDYSTPQKSPGFRESIAARRSSQEGHRELHRVASLVSDSGGRRRFLDPNTPPVLEEEGGRDDYQVASQSKRRVTSFVPYGSRRATDMPSRTSSLSQRRQAMVG